MAKTSWRCGDPLEPSVQERLRALIRERGEREVAKRIGASEIALCRAALGLGVRRGTAKLIEIEIEKIAGEARAA